jgi:hypothetical protein
MTGFHADSVRYNEQDYEDCTVIVDEVTQQVEISYTEKKLMRSRTLPLVKLGYGAQSKVSREGAALTLDAISIVASSEELAAMEGIFSAPRSAVLAKAESDLANAEKQVLEFLNVRGETLAFLQRLRADPREVLLQLYLAQPGETGDRLDGYLRARAELTTAALDRLDAVLADLGGRADPLLIERLYAITYVIGLAQSNVFEKGEAGLAEGFVTRLGFQPSDFRNLMLRDIPQKLLAAAHPSLVALLR